MKDPDEIRQIGNELIEAADQLEFERGIVGEAVRILQAIVRDQNSVDLATVKDFLRKYENRTAIYASEKLWESGLREE